MRLAIVTSHPIQYQVPWFRALAQHVDLHVYFAHRPAATEQATAGYGVAFEWDVDLLSGYAHTFLENVAPRPNVFHFGGCDTPGVRAALQQASPEACIVTGWFLKSYWQAIRACHALDVPVLVRGDSQLDTPRSRAKRIVKEVAYRWVMRQFDGFLCVGQRNMQYVRHYGAPAERVFFAPHFVDTDFFRSRSSLGADARLRTREALGIEADEIVVLFVGRLIALKRPADVPRALVGLRGNGRSYRAVFAGAGPLEAEVRETGRRLGVATTLLGFRNQTELPAVYAAADMLVLPSEQETWGLVVNEAMACGLPVVVSDRVGCAPDMVEPGTTGEVFRCGDVAELASAIGRVSSRLGSAAVAEALQRRTQAYSCERACLTALRAIDAVRGQRTYSSRRTD